MFASRDKKLGCMLQLTTKTFFSIISAVLLCNMVMAEDNQLSENSRFMCVKQEQGAPITAIAAYDNGRSAICGDRDGNIYVVSSNGFHKVVNNTFGNINSIVVGDIFAKEFYFTSNGKVYKHKGGKIIEISENLSREVESLYKDNKSNRIFAVTKNNDVYSLSINNSLYWIAPNLETSEKILKNLAYISNNNDSVRKDLEFELNQNICSYVESYGKKFIGTSTGQIYISNPYEPQKIIAKAEYVSEAPSAPNSSIYRVTIRGCALNTKDIFTTGYNGFKYTLNSDNGYFSDAYPINGMTYDSDYKDKATLQTREISFLWLGPKCTSEGDHKLTVDEFAFNMSADSDNKIQLFDNVTIDLPVAKAYAWHYSDYKIEIVTEDGRSSIITESNGTCATPFTVLIREKNGNKILPPDNNIYDHIVFCTTNNNKAKGEPTYSLVGCDPYKSEIDPIVILPSSSAEIDGYVKYGIIGKNCKLSGGKTFYVYAKADGQYKVLAGFVDNNIINNNLAAEITIEGVSTHVNITPAGDIGTNHPGGRDFLFSGNVLASNWQGCELGFGGYLDYQLTGDDSYKGVFVYLPEGLNSRPNMFRKDLRSLSLKIGYYFDPQIDSSLESPLWVKKYHINDTPAWCDKMVHDDLHAMLFDQYGRAAMYDMPNDVVRDAYAARLWNYRAAGTKSDWSNPIKILMQVGNLYNTPIIMGSPDESFGVTHRGLFVPPLLSAEAQGYSDVNASFLSETLVWINNSYTLPQEIDGYSMTCSPESPENRLFYNTLSFNAPFCCTDIVMSVTDKDLKLLTENSTNPSGITSLNRVRVFSPGWWVSDWLDSWTVYHVDPNTSRYYASFYNFNYYRWGGIQGAFSPDGYYYGEYMWAQSNQITAWIRSLVDHDFINTSYEGKNLPPLPISSKPPVLKVIRAQN